LKYVTKANIFVSLFEILIRWPTHVGMRTDQLSYVTVCVCVCFFFFLFFAVNLVMKIRKISISFPMSTLLCMHLCSSNRQY